MKKALQINEEILTIDGCQKLINVWQFRMRWLYFEIRKIGRYYYNLLQKVMDETTNEIKNEELFESFSKEEQIKLERLLKLITLMSIVYNKVMDVNDIQSKLFIKYFGKYGTTPELSYPYGGFLGKDRIEECGNLELKY